MKNTEINILEDIELNNPIFLSSYQFVIMSYLCILATELAYPSNIKYPIRG
jgi:hypothetical protein